jgi:hypothetical protein
MAICTKCGASVEGQFCTSCGTPVSFAGVSGPPPPEPGPPQPPVSQSAAAPVNIAPKKRGPLFWILTGCLGLILVFIAISVSCGLFWWNKAKQAGIDTDLMESNPGLAIAKLLAASNPNIEVLSVDEDEGIIRVRDKKTGKSMTMDLSEAKNGKIVFRDEDNQNLEIQTQGEGDSASIQMSSPDGTARIGAGAAQLPDWLPAYPGAKSGGSIGASSGNGKTGTETFETSDSAEDVASFYERSLKNAGMAVEKTSFAGSDKESMTVISAKSSDEQRSGVISVARKEGKTMVSLSFESK